MVASKLKEIRMFNIKGSTVYYNDLIVCQCPNESVAVQTAINLSHRYGDLAEFQVEELIKDRNTTTA